MVSQLPQRACSLNRSVPIGRTAISNTALGQSSARKPCNAIQNTHTAQSAVTVQAVQAVLVHTVLVLTALSAQQQQVGEWARCPLRYPRPAPALRTRPSQTAPPGASCPC
jgi:hypothetical protein